MSIMTTTPATEAVLRVIAEAGAVRTSTLPRLVPEYSARQLSLALTSLFADGLIDGPAGRYGEYRLTERGESVVAQLPRVSYLEQVTPHPGGSAFHSETGHVAVGLGRDGDLLYWKLWNEIGALPGLVVGGTGSGGTNLLAGLIEATMPQPRFVRTWVIDTDHQLSEYWSRVDRVGIQNPAVDALLDKAVGAQTRPQLVAALRALDRVLRHGHYVVPHWYGSVHRVAWRAGRFEQPAVTPRYYQPEYWITATWWASAANLKGER